MVPKVWRRSIAEEVELSEVTSPELPYSQLIDSKLIPNVNAVVGVNTLGGNKLS